MTPAPNRTESLDNQRISGVIRVSLACNKVVQVNSAHFLAGEAENLGTRKEDRVATKRFDGSPKVQIAQARGDGTLSAQASPSASGIGHGSTCGQSGTPASL